MSRRQRDRRDRQEQEAAAAQAVRAAEGHSAPVQGRSMEGDPGVAEMVVVEESEALVPVSRQQVQGDLRAEAVASAQLPPEASPPPEQLDTPVCCTCRRVPPARRPIHC